MSASWPSAVVFDLDGTLIDSLPDIAAALNGLMERRGLPVFGADAVRRMIGKGVPVLVQRGFAANGVALEGARFEAEVEAYLAIYEPRAALETRPYPGVEAEMRRLAAAGVRMAVCTNKPAAISREILERFGLLSYCDAVIGGDHGVPRKPAPDLLLATLATMGARPTDAVMVGDSEADVAAARAAGVPVVAVGYGYSAVPAEELGADACVGGFDELAAAFDRLGVARHERA